MMTKGYAKGSSAKSIKAAMTANKPAKQAVAIALSTARKAKKGK